MILAAHGSWNVEEAYDYLDANNDGEISVEEIRQVMQKYHIDETLVSHLSSLCASLDKNPDMTISLSKFKEIVEPITQSRSSTRPRCPHQSRPRAQELNFEEQNCQKLATLETLMDLLNFTLQMQVELDSLKVKYMLDAESLFDEID